MDNLAYIGVVDQGRLRVLAADGDATGTFDLVAPGGGSIDLERHSGLLVMVRGIHRGDAIHDATVIEVASELTTALGKHLFDPDGTRGAGAPEG